MKNLSSPAISVFKHMKQIVCSKLLQAAMQHLYVIFSMHETWF